MAAYVYRPDHPQANERGMVDKSVLYDDGGEWVHGVISDTMDETRHMANGKYYTSKSEFRRVTKAHGCIEVGNETATMLKPRKPIEMSREERRRDIRQAIDYLKSQS